MGGDGEAAALAPQTTAHLHRFLIAPRRWIYRWITPAGVPIHHFFESQEKALAWGRLHLAAL